MAMLSVHDLSYGYSARPVLRNIGFSVPAGTICGLLGPNASGKTTLLKCINGILKPAGGQVQIGGRVVAELSRKTLAGLMAMVPQLATVAFSFTALQMVVMARTAELGAFGTPSRKDYRDAEQALAELGLMHLKDRGFNELSGGERQMVLLARALFQNPCMLLLDEPTSHLDFRNQHIVLDMVRTVTRARNLTTIVTLHDPNLALRYCSRMVMMKQGRVHREGAAEDVFEEEALEAMYGMKVSIESNCSGKCFVMPSADEGRPVLQRPERHLKRVL